MFTWQVKMNNIITEGGFDDFKTTFSDLGKESGRFNTSHSEEDHESMRTGGLCESDSVDKIHESTEADKTEMTNKPEDQKNDAYGKCKNITAVSSDVEIHGDGMKYDRKPWNEYIGSVRFFRHVIVCFVLIVITFLSITTVTLSIKLAEYRGQGGGVPISSAYASDKSEDIHNKDGGEEAPFLKMGYQAMYPNMFSKTEIKPDNSSKMVYLTFDDGPSALTNEVLDILQVHNIKATFFVVGTQITAETAGIIKRISDDGHAIGVHTTSHNYSQIYDSVESYLDDFYLTYDMIYQITGEYPEIFRFPGGSVNSYNSGIYTEIIAEMTRRGFAYYDWNVSAQDASSKATESTILQNALKGLSMDSNIFLLMHDTKQKSVSAIEQIIVQYEAKGFTFNKLSKNVKGVSFAYI